MNRIRQIVKRDGRTVPFELDKISDAIFKAAQVLGGRDKEMSKTLANDVEAYLLDICHNSIPIYKAKFTCECARAKAKSHKQGAE